MAISASESRTSEGERRVTPQGNRKLRWEICTYGRKWWTTSGDWGLFLSLGQIDWLVDGSAEVLGPEGRDVEIWDCGICFGFDHEFTRTGRGLFSWLEGFGGAFTGKRLGE